MTRRRTIRREAQNKLKISHYQCQLAIEKIIGCHKALVEAGKYCI
jgi:hypothetical protein